MAKDKKQDLKRDFAIGMAAGAAGQLAALPFDKVIDPITAKNYHEALKVDVSGVTDSSKEMVTHLSKTNPKLLESLKKNPNRSFAKYLVDQTKTTFWKDPYTGRATGELKTLPLKMLEKGMVFGTSMLATGALYRALGDKQPIEKQGALQLIGQLFNETTRNINR